MKATKEKTEPKVMGKTDTQIQKSNTLMPADNLIDKFKHIKDRIPELDKMSASLKIDTPEILVVATNNASLVNDYLKEVENTRKILKEPYAVTVKLIDGYCKNITDMLSRIKERLSSEIANYKIVQEAAAKVNQESKMKELNKLEEDKKGENERISRIEKQLNARIYGGIYYAKNGDRRQNAGTVKSSDCDTLLGWIDENIPESNTFVYLVEQYEDMVRRSKKRLAEHKANLIAAEAPGEPYKREKALQKISEARSQAEVENIDNLESVNKKIDREVKIETNKTERDIFEAGKGIRELLKHEVIDESLVPRDFFSIDESKINQYVGINRDKIKEDIQQGTETIPGIKFYIDPSFIVR